MEKKRIFFTIFKAGQILKKFFHIASDFEYRNLKGVRFTANFLQLVNFSIELLKACQIWRHFFTARQILNRKLYNASSFEVKLFLENQVPWERFLSKKSYFCVISHR